MRVNFDMNFTCKLCLTWNSTLIFMVENRTKVCSVMICSLLRSVKHRAADNLWRCVPRLQKLNQTETKNNNEFNCHSGSSVKQDTAETSCDVPRLQKLKRWNWFLCPFLSMLICFVHIVHADYILNTLYLSRMHLVLNESVLCFPCHPSQQVLSQLAPESLCMPVLAKE